MNCRNTLHPHRLRPLAAALLLALPLLAQAQSGIEDLGTLGGTGSAALSVSADGAVVVGNSRLGGGTIRAFRWTSAGGMTDLGALDGTNNSWATYVSADGTVVVGSSNIAGVAGAVHAFRWAQAGGMVDLGSLGGTQSTAQGVAADGSVVVGAANIVGDASVVLHSVWNLSGCLRE